MTTFRVLFHGTDYDLYTEDGQKIGGFYVSVVVEADNAKQACVLAHDKLISSDPYRAVFREQPQAGGVLSVEACEETLDSALGEADVSGFVFYPPERVNP